MVIVVVAPVQVNVGFVRVLDTEYALVVLGKAVFTLIIQTRCVLYAMVVGKYYVIAVKVAVVAPPVKDQVRIKTIVYNHLLSGLFIVFQLILFLQFLPKIFQ